MSSNTFIRCSYCGSPAQCRDHVVPKSLWSKYSCHWTVVGYVRETVPACNNCNLRKGTRALVPPSWASRLDALNEIIPTRAWRVWDGDPRSPAYTETHLPPGI